VSYVGKISDSAVAVVASSVWGAMEGRRALNVSWDEGPNKDLNSAQIYDSLKRAASSKAASLYSAGDVTKAAGRRITAAYQLPFMAHAPWSRATVPRIIVDRIANCGRRRRFRRMFVTRRHRPLALMPIR